MCGKDPDNELQTAGTCSTVSFNIQPGSLFECVGGDGETCDELLKRVVSVFIAHSTTNCSLVGRFLRGVHPASLAAALPSLAFPQPSTHTGQTTVYIII